MNPVKPVRFRKKDEFVTLPPIPQHFGTDCESLERELRFSNERQALKLKKIYRFLDGYGDFVSTFAVCQKGCAHCCHIDVAMTPAEAALIEQETGQKKQTPRGAKSSGHTTACPFLSENMECTIYHVRPFHCRTFHTLDDPKYCASGEPHKVYGSMNGKYTVRLYAQLSRFIRTPDDPLWDIRDFFPRVELPQ